MPQYLITGTLTPSNAALGTPICALTTDSTEFIKIVRIRLSLNTAAIDNAITLRILRNSTKGNATFGSATIIKKDPSAPASVTTAEVATASGNTTGTIIDTIDEIAFNTRGMIEWEAIDDDDCIIINGGNIFELFATSSGITAAYRYTVEWKEN